MALVNCIECGSSVSDKAPACPKCGRPQAYAKSDAKIDAKAANTAIWMVICVPVALAIALGLVAGIMLNQQRANEATKKSREDLDRATRAISNMK